MTIKNELKTNLDRVTESTPFQAVTGAGDLAAEKIREVPAKLAALDLPGKIDELQVRLGDAQGKVQDRLTALKVDPKEVQAKAQAKAKALPERATDLAMQITGKVVQTYGELAQRGKAVIDRRRAQDGGSDLPLEGELMAEPTAEVAEEPATVVAEVVEAPAEPTPAEESAPAEIKVPQARKTASPNRTKRAPSKTTTEV